MESPVQPARLSNPHHRSGGVGIKNPAAFPATASPDLGKVCFDASFHVVIIIRLRSNFKFLCGFPASLDVCSTAFTIARNKVKLGVERATVPARAIQLPPGGPGVAELESRGRVDWVMSPVPDFGTFESRTIQLNFQRS